MRLRATLAAVVVSCSWFAASVAAASDEAAALVEPVITPGQEALIAGMLGRGMALPDCTLVSCGVNQTVIAASYDCVDGAVTFELGHPQIATAPSARTAQFAVTVRDGTPSRAFGDAILSLVRARESRFMWAWAESGSETEPDDAAE